MADFSSYTHKWRATTNTNNHSSGDKVTKRNRQPVSCQPCRARKLKCNRKHPCDGCEKRNEADACVYGKTAATPATTVSPVSRKDESRVSALKAQDRLKHLEDLVRNMVDSPKGIISPPPDDTPSTNLLEGSAEDVPGTRTSIDGGSYTGSTHWSAILQHIYELKNDIVSAPAVYEDEAIDFSKPDALFGAPRPPSLEHILKAHLPPRAQVDRRISHYFNARYMIIPIIHAKQFRRQYEKFWQDPLGANIMWVSVMFSICCLAASLTMAANQSPKHEEQGPNPRDSFQTAAGQCLVLGNYSKPQPHVVEALALFLQCKYTSSLDPQREVALMFGVQVRLAYLMGYHRDGSNFPNQFTPFEAEMRRRTWAMVKQFDLLVAFQLGIPNNIPSDTWDTRTPSNLLDYDFDEDCKELPPSRPENDLTQILYFVVKARIIDVYAKICHHSIAFSSTPPTVSQIMALDAELRKQAGAIPETLQVRPVSESITDPAYEVMVRVNISYLWRKSLCVLHRKYMTTNGNEYSYNTCVETASSMCATMIDIYPEFQPGGTYENDSWMVTSFTIIDFLLALIVLCLAMSVSRKKYVNTGGDPQKWLTLDETQRILEILDKSETICIDLGQRSREAKRVSGVLKAVLVKLRTPKQGPAAGPDGARYFLNMSNGTLREDRPYKTPKGVYDRDGISLKPLSLAERPTSVTMASGMCPPEYYLPDNTVETPSLGQITLSPSQSQSPPTQATLNPKNNHTNNAQVDLKSNRFMGNAAAPPTFNMDVDLGPFSEYMAGLESDNLNSIDWTQFDQFAGGYVTDNTFGMFDPANLSGPSTNNQPQVEFMPMDYENWESTPIYSLGAKARDPVTGQSSAP